MANFSASELQPHMLLAVYSHYNRMRITKYDFNEWCQKDPHVKATRDGNNNVIYVEYFGRYGWEAIMDYVSKDTINIFSKTFKTSKDL